MSSVNVRYMVDDVDEAVAFYTKHLGFTLLSSAAPAFADVARGDLRLLLSGPTSSAGRPMPDGTKPVPGGWNRIEFVVDDIVAEVDRLRGAGLRFRNDIVTGPGGSRSCSTIPRGTRSSCSSPLSASSHLGASAAARSRPGEPLDDRRERLEVVVAEHDVADAPLLAALRQEVAELVDRADERDARLERVVGLEPEAGASASASPWRSSVIDGKK